MTAKKSSKASRGAGVSAENRRRELLEAAAKLFSSRGYDGTSIRDIATAVGMLPGSIYYHFSSKEELLLAVHRQGVQQVVDAVEHALGTAKKDPWERVVAAATAHLETLLDENAFSQVVTPQFTRAFPEPLKSQLIAERDRYEKMIARLVDDLSLPPHIDHRYFRLALLGSLNWSLTWFRKGRDTPSYIAKKMLEIYKHSVN